MKNIYILYSCNGWKEYSSMSLVAATTSLNKLKNIIIQIIKDGDMEYKRGHDDFSVNEQIKLLNADWKINGSDFVFDNIDYGYVEIVLDGEIQ